MNRLEAARRGAARQGGGALRPVGHDGQPGRAPRAARARRRGAGRAGLPHPALRIGSRRRPRRASRSRRSAGGGRFDAEDVRARAPAADDHFAPTAWSRSRTPTTTPAARLPVRAAATHRGRSRASGTCGSHLDGARLFNAVVASGIPAAAWAAPFDTVSVCLSKGLGAPVGSVRRRLAGPSARSCTACASASAAACARRAMLAAAGLHALEHHVERLARRPRQRARASRRASRRSGCGSRRSPRPTS